MRAGLAQELEAESQRSARPSSSPSSRAPSTMSAIFREVQRAKAFLPKGFLALMVVNKVVKDSFPAKQPGESDEECFKRLQAEVRTNETLWKGGILSGAVFPPPAWITGALAQDNGWQVGPGDLKSARNVPHARRVHVEGWVYIDGKPEIFVIYPQGIDRGRGLLEIGAAGRIAQETIRYAHWAIRDGWVNSRKPPRQIVGADTTTSDDGSAASALRPKWG
jgi:hypothetical protein